MANLASLKTCAGPVGLRPKRDPMQIKVEGAGDRPVVVKKGWLAEARDQYHKCVLQVMHVASVDLSLVDASDPEWGKKFSAEQKNAWNQRKEKLRAGAERFVLPEKKKKKLGKMETRDSRARDVLVKFSKRMCPHACNRRERAFIIENGEILVYKGHSETSKLKIQYKMKDADCKVETPSMVQYPVWDAGYPVRLRVDTAERKQDNKTPIYLYATEAHKVNRWKRAFQLARVLTSNNDRMALRTCLGRATSASLIKGWESLFTYSKEVSSTKALVKQMAMRLMKVELSRAYTKLRMAYREHLEAQRFRMEQQLWAARFMSEKLGRLGSQNAKSASDVREAVITRIQQRFRRFRDDRIFDRTYPLTAGSVSKSQQAKLGRTIDFSIRALECAHVLQLSFHPESEEARLSQAMGEMFKTKKPTYSEVTLPVNTVHVYLNDNMTNLCFSQNVESLQGHESLTKADWSKFINLDRIGSVVVFADPIPGARLKDAKGGEDSGVWFTINGPRLSWGQKIDSTTGAVKGVTNGMVVPEKLARREDQTLLWQTFRVKCTEAHYKSKKKSEDQPKSRIKIVVHVLGYAFDLSGDPQESQDDEKDPEAVRTSVQFVNKEEGKEISVPVSPIDPDDAYAAAFENSEVGVEIYEVKEFATDGNASRLLFTGSESLAKVLGYPDGVLQPDFADFPPEEFPILCADPFKLPDPKTYRAIMDKAKGNNEGASGLVNFINEYSADTPFVMIQISPQGSKKAGVPQAFKDRGIPISPEFIGSGVTTSFFTSHRGAWFDQRLGPGKFRADHVANYIELSLQALRFPQKERKKEDFGRKYFVKASLCGFSSTSPVLTRPKEPWVSVMGVQSADPKFITQIIQFLGAKLFLPLPPGCWSKEFDSKRKVLVQVLRIEEETPPAINYDDFIKTPPSATSGRPGKSPEVVYESTVVFDNLLVDIVKPVSCFLGDAKAKKGKMPQVNALDNNRSGEATDGCLNFDFALRDRDYVKAVTGGCPPVDMVDMNDSSAAEEKRSLCIGDKAMLMVEEPITYPPAPEEYGKREYRKRIFPGHWDAEKSKKAQRNKDLWPEEFCTLRQPCLSSEYADSGLGTLQIKKPFKQSFIPNFCTDILPHEFVLPLTERQFTRDHFPGVYSRILDDLAKQPPDPMAQRRGNTVQRKVVTRLSHLTKRIPVTLLAVYADDTCDVEVLGDFIQTWSKEPYRRFAIPGKLIKENRKASQLTEGPPRALLKRVPMRQVLPVHGAGFNIYDATMWNSSDVLARPPPAGGFDPRTIEPGLAAQAQTDASKFSLAAGPLPPDVSNAACEYEWTVRMRASSAAEMYKFVAMLRRCVRMDNFQQASKMLEYQARAAADQNQPQQQMALPTVGGLLDVLLVEARRLQPPPAVLNRPEVQMRDDYLELEGTTSHGKTIKATPKGNTLISTYVNFKLVQDGRIVPYKGQKVQQSSKFLYSDSPKWASMEGYRQAGGVTFRTGFIDPEKKDDLIIDLEVMMTSPYQMMPSRIGGIQIPVTRQQFLCSPEKPFRDIWVPLLGENNLANKTGELHLMCRWLPASQISMGPSVSLSTQVSVKSQFHKELWPRVCAQRLREPIYNIEARYLHYNPNLVKGGLQPEMPKDFILRHAEELYHAVHYLECLERRNTAGWDNFEKDLGELKRVRVGELRLKWMAENNEAKLNALAELVRMGIPSARRADKWAEFTLASRVMERIGLGEARPQAQPGQTEQVWEKEYKQMLEQGSGMRSDAIAQLQEDAFNLAGWESSVPPIQELTELHLKRVKKAQNVCTALIATQQKGSGIVYCESLLVLAFFLLLPQGNKEDKLYDEDHRFLKSMSEVQAFWLLFTLTCTRVNGTYKEYYGTPQPIPDAEGNISGADELVSTSGAMHDVHLLECCIAYHLPEVWERLNSIGFQLATVFYSAFMRLFATFMPTSTVFRFWDLLFAQSTDPKAEPHARVYLIDLAFGVIKSKRADFLLCESAAEVRDLILGVLGSIYDMTTVVDIVMMAHKFLWGGGGFSSGKVGFLWTQRDDMFKVVNTTAKRQNAVLKILCHTGKLGSKQQEAGAVGVTSKELMSEVLKVIYEGLKKREAGRTWFMHRPAPLAARMLCENSLDQAWNLFNKSLQVKPPPPTLPSLMVPPEGPATTAEGRMPACLEPLDVTEREFVEVLQKSLPGWHEKGSELWKAFSNRQDLLQPKAYGQAVPEDPAQQGTDANAQLGGLWKKLKVDFGLEHPPRGPQALAENDCMSLNELFMSLIVASKGTVGEKASFLFSWFAYSAPGRQDGSAYHAVSVSKLAKSLTKATDGNSAAEKNVSPPEIGSEEAARNALCFTVYSNYPQKNTVLGTVFVPSLGPYISYETADVPTSKFNIWGTPAPTSRKMNDASAAMSNSAGLRYRFTPRVPDGYDKEVLKEGVRSAFLDKGLPEYEANEITIQIVGQRDVSVVVTGTAQALNALRVNAKKIEPAPGLVAIQEEKEKLVCIGEMEMSITWGPRSVRNTEEGQLMIHLKSIRFFQIYVSDFYKINPWVKVKTFEKGQDPKGREASREVDIKRWDPRGLVSRDGQQSWLTTHGAYGGVIEFEQTMRDALFGQQGQGFHKYVRDADGMGYDGNSETWNWNEVWGKQYSIENLKIQKEFVEVPPRKNTIDLHAARLVASMILQRSMFNMTNRQALLISDAIFNRYSVVPGFLEVYLVKEDVETLKQYASLAHIKSEYSEARRLDVTGKVAIEHERQIVLNGGQVNLFTDRFTGVDRSHPLETPTLQSMGIKDPWKGSNKSLCLRFVRGGDGARMSQIIGVDGRGEFQPLDIESGSFEIQLEKRDSWPHTKLSKEEFVQCVVESPLLSESIRRLGSSSERQAAATKTQLTLDVTLMDAHGEEEEQQFMEALTFGQTLLFEVWDSDVMSRDFLGEAWMPPLSTLGPRLKDVVLPLKPVDYDEEAENGPSRHDRKELDDSKDAHKTVTGELYVSIAWKYPAYTLVEGDGREGVLKELDDNGAVGKTIGLSDSENIKDRAQIQRKLHSGKLTVTIERAKNLRRSDWKKGRACDPQVFVYVRNDANGRWRKKPMIRTPVKTNTRNPEWNFTQSHELLTGDYETRFPPIDESFFAEAKAFFKTNREKERLALANDLKAVKKFDHQGLKIKFGPAPADAAASGATQDNMGKNHKVEVYLHDSIREFKAKVQEACAKEKEHWMKASGERSKEAQAYDEIEVSYKHLVMVFIPSAKVMRLYEQKMSDSQEYRLAYEQAQSDPSCWQPLDPIRTFAQYTQYGFSRPRTTVPLRIVEATDAYKLNNLRYKEFEREQTVKGYHDKDDEATCFGWTKYLHEFDHAREGQDPNSLDDSSWEPSFEWRPCFVSQVPKKPSADPKAVKEAAKGAQPNSPAPAAPTRASYKVKFLHESSKADPSKPGQQAWPEMADEKKRNKDVQLKQDVLLKPRTPLFDSIANPEHEEFLEQADLFRKMGKSDFEIAETLQKMMKENWEKNNPPGSEITKELPPPITVDVVRSYIQQQEVKAAKEKDQADKKLLATQKGKK